MLLSKCQFNETLKSLKRAIKIESKFKDFIKQALFLHSMVHSSKMSSCNKTTYEDELWEGLNDNVAKTAVNKKGRTVVYGIWHSTRIEDITVNLLVNNSKQILNEKWIKKIKSSISDTGNQLSPKEILEFSKNINVKELRAYRLAVGRKTQETIKGLRFPDLKRKFSKDSLERIFREKAVAKHPDAEWLVKFWGNKDVSGIITMPIARHNLVHINESNQAKLTIKK